MDIDTHRSMRSEAAEDLRRATACSEAAERTTDPEIWEMLLRLVADLTAAALSATSSGSTPRGQPKLCRVSQPGAPFEPSTHRGCEKWT